MKYEEVFCAVDSKTRTLDEVTHIYKTDPERYANTLDKQMFCPGCRKVHIAYADAKRPYLRGFPNEPHDDDCIYKKDELSQIEVEGLRQDQAGRDEIKNQMGKLVLQFLRNEGTKDGGTKGNSVTKTGTTGTANKRKWQVTKVVPRKQLNAPFHDDDYGVDKLFYGRVYIGWEENKYEKGKMKLLVWGITTQRLICKLYISSKVYEHISEEFKNPREYEAFVVFLCSLSKREKTARWSKGDLIHSDFLTIKKLAKPNNSTR
ncbi:MAG: hypothetical protein IJX67_08995 [Oscillospiraceae bacterium]|nr:hypothetical protein [Oscillospiraceae bacterium]